MLRQPLRTYFAVLSTFIVIALVVPSLCAQTSGVGLVSVTVADPTGAAVPGAQLKLVDISTHDQRTATALVGGNYTFANLPPGTYSLTVSRAGFETAVYQTVLVNLGRTTDVTVALKVGAVETKVEVRAEATPILQVSSTTLSSTIDMKQLQDLPLFGRNLLAMAYLVPGYQRGGAADDSTFNGLPGGSLNFTVDGVVNVAQMWKSAGTSFNAPPVTARLEGIQEMTIATSDLDASAGNGQAAMQVQFVTKRGGNQWHGGIFEQHRNAALNAKSWFQNAVGLKKGKFVLNDFGGNIGGPVLKNKLFFFASMADSRQPQNSVVQSRMMTPEAEQGIYKYLDGNGQVQSINVLQIAGASGNQSTPDPVMAAQFAKIDAARKLGRVASMDLNHDILYWNNYAMRDAKYPTLRVDYNLSEKFRVNTAFNWTKTKNSNIYPLPYPGGDFDKLNTGSESSQWVWSGGFEWTVSPSMINSFKMGKLNVYQAFSPEAAPLNSDSKWVICGFSECGMSVVAGQSRNSPVINMGDNLVYQRGKHSFTMGGSFMRTNEYYWNAPSGYPFEILGIAYGDPVQNPLIAAMNAAGVPGYQQYEPMSLYGDLTGRINVVFGSNAIDAKTKQFKSFIGYNSHQRVSSWGLFAQDSWRIRPNVTVNYGMRWDFVGDVEDQTGVFSSPDIQNFWGPSGVGNLFQPGVLKGVQDPQVTLRAKLYNPSYINPEPHIGIAWNPRVESGMLGKLLGGQKTVLRASYSLKKYTEGDFGYLSAASGPVSSQSFWLYAVPGLGGIPGFFEPGTLSVSSKLSNYGVSPDSYHFPLAFSNFTWQGNSLNTIDPNIKQPYVQTWNFGVQRAITDSTVIEARYVGNHTVHSWMAYNLNEINIFESGLLKDFQNAQKNLAIYRAANPGCDAAGTCNFGNSGLPGQFDLPLLNAAFGNLGGAVPGLDPTMGFLNGGFITQLDQGQAGAMANQLTQQTYFCRLVGSAFSPCVDQGLVPADAPKGAYPINVFQANPFVTGLRLMASEGYSNYNGLQLELRQRPLHGLQFSSNYTFSKSLGVSPQKAIGSDANYITLRNKRLNYAPTAFDIRHSFNFSGTYDLPFGNGRALVNRKGVLNKIVGGWTLGTIFQISSGAPFLVNGGGYQTVNGSDSGVILNGITKQELQDNVGIYNVPGKAYVSFINPKLLDASGRLSEQYVTSPMTAGQFGQFVYLYGPSIMSMDAAITKHVSIREGKTLTFQAEFLNALNHPRWLPFNRFSNSVSITSTSFGQTNVTAGDSSAFGSTGDPRNIQLRLSFDF